MTTDRIIDSWSPSLEADVDREVRAAATLQAFAEGTHLFHRSDPCSQLVVVGNGSIRVYAVSDVGRQVTLYRVREGETCLLTLTCVLGNRRYAGQAVAETDLEVALLPAPNFRDWVDRSPRLREYVFSFIAERTGGLVDLIESLFIPLERRLAGTLLDAFGEGGHLSATHTELAADTGTSREVISRHLKDFEKQGVIDLGRGFIDLRDRAGLEEISYQGNENPV